MIALDARLATSFTAGLLAVMNPCGFVLLPTYLVYFLGMDNLRPGAERAPMLRAVKVSVAVSAGFMSIFVVIGAITKLSTGWFVQKAHWVALLIGIAMFALGVATLFGYRIRFVVPRLDIGRRDRGIRSMYVFGLAYAVASIGCTIGPFTGTVLGSFSTKGLRTGITAIALYGVAMALVVAALTVTLAFANTALLHLLRRGMAWVEQATGVLLILTGLYLCWYWYSDITAGSGGAVVAKATGWQSRLQDFIQQHQSVVVAVGLIIVAAALITAFRPQRSEPAA
ncbi:MAG: cytochrome c-type biosis protein [Ilumatobacteraceae bacterium]